MAVLRVAATFKVAQAKACKWSVKAVPCNRARVLSSMEREGQEKWN